MGKDILKLKPESVWRNFYELTQIPRPSKKEKKAIKYLKRFELKNFIPEAAPKLIFCLT